MSDQSAEQIIEQEVRELIRRRSLDPQDGDVATVRTLIDEVVADYSDRGLSAVMPPLVDPGQTAKTVADRVIGLGPLQEYLEDPGVEEIWINEPGKVLVAKAGRHILTNTHLTEQQIQDLVELMLRPSGRRVDLSSPMVDATLTDGSRLHVVIPPITRRYWAINIRKFIIETYSLAELIRLGTITQRCARFLEASVVAGLNIVVAGPTQAGKTTMLNCLAASIPPRERVITIEEVFELQIGLPDVVAMQTRQPNLEGEGEIRQRRLVNEALRMRPSRIIVGEVRQEEAFDLLIGLNSGLPGMTSIHANSAREALTKLTTLPLLAGGNVSDRFVLPTVASCIHLIVFLSYNGRGPRRVEEIIGMTGGVEADIIQSAQLFQRTGNELTWAEQYPPYRERYEAAGYNLTEVLR